MYTGVCSVRDCDREKNMTDQIGEITTTHLDNLLSTIVSNYESSLYCNSKERADEFANELSYKFGKKYIKILRNGSAWGFVVNSNNDVKFKKGTLLKAASWSAPARNFPRGNVLEGDFSWVSWTGLSGL